MTAEMDTSAIAKTSLRNIFVLLLYEVRDAPILK